MDLEATKSFRGPYGSLLGLGALFCFVAASALLLTARQGTTLDQVVSRSTVSSIGFVQRPPDVGPRL